MSHATRMGYLTFATVAIGLFAGFVLALLAAVAVQDSDGTTGAVGVAVTPLPAVVAAGVWAVVNRFETGRKWLAVISVFFGSLAALILMLPWGPPGLLVAMATAGLFGVLARRLLNRPVDSV